MELLDALRETWQSPSMRHAALVHLPVALSLIGAVFAILTAINRGRNATLVWTTIGLYVAMMVVGWLAKNSGENAEDALPAELSSAARELIHEHEELGEKVWMLALATGAIIGIAFMLKPVPKVCCLWVGAAAALVTAGWVGNAAHFGGEAVYEHGAGVKREAASAPGTGTGAGIGSGSPMASDDPRVAFFVSDVKPILESVCMKCHNAAKHKGGLDQTTLAGILKGGKSGPAIVPGDPDASLLIRAVRYTEPEDWGMPPTGKLKDEQIKALEKWVADGAAWW